MGTLTISIDAGAAGAYDKVFNVTNANLGRLVDWAKANLFPASASPTNAQALEAWAAYIMQQTKNSVLSHEQRNTMPPTFDYS